MGLDGSQAVTSARRQNGNFKEVISLQLGFVFPGQGAQYVGMGKDLIERYPIARETFEEADDVLGFSLTKLCLEGPEEQLRLTYHTQPALLTMSVAAYRVFRHHSNVP